MKIETLEQPDAMWIFVLIPRSQTADGGLVPTADIVVDSALRTE